MIRMCEDVSGPATISQRLAWSHSYAQCRCVWTKDGTKFSSICPISRDGRTAPIMWKLCGCKFMPIAEYDAYTFRIDCTRKMSCHPNSNYFCPFRSRRPKQSQLSLESTPIRDVLPYQYLFHMHFLLLYHWHQAKSLTQHWGWVINWWINF